jgi:glycosyltransferase involved in cell wall biosynthesis
MPCYNAARYVAAAVESALSQTWQDRELIVVDDGSTDGSGEILDRFVARGVKVIHQQNRGQCAAANRALAEASGAYIKFFDADDLMSPNMLELQMAKLAGDTSAVASAEWGRFYGDDIGTFKLNPESVWRDMDAREWLVQAWRNGMPMMQCALWLIPRPLLERSGGWDERLSLINDFEFFARVLCHASDVRFTKDARLFYRSGLSGSLSGARRRSHVESDFLSRMEGTGHVLARRHDAAARLSCANMLQGFVYTYYPQHSDLVARMVARVRELGGADLPPRGTPGFELLRPFVGWKLARRVEQAAVGAGINRAGVKRRLAALAQRR